MNWEDCFDSEQEFLNYISCEERDCECGGRLKVSSGWIHGGRREPNYDATLICNKCNEQMTVTTWG